MKKSSFFKSLPFKLLVGVVIGILAGLALNANDGTGLTNAILNIIVTLKYVLGQIISFCVPLIIIGFIAPSITKMGNNASRLLLLAVCIAYVFSIMIGLAAAWNKAKLITGMLEEFQKIVLSIVSRILIPILPLFIGFTFCSLAYEGSITKQLPVFLKVIIIVMIGHYIWMALLYTIAGAYSGKNPLEVVKHYGPAYLTAVGTMSSAATLGVALQCAGKAKPLRKDMVQFGIPLFANIHLCGSVLTEVFFCMTISQILYGKLPSIPTMLLFCILLGVFAIGAPGVPGGTVMASLGLITGVLLFDDAGTALMLTIFALQDSFGTACNVTGDGALTLILTGYAERHKIPEKSDEMRNIEF